MRPEKTRRNKTPLFLAETSPFWKRFVADTIRIIPWIDYNGCIATWDELCNFRRTKSTILILADSLLEEVRTENLHRFLGRAPHPRIALLTSREDPVTLHRYDAAPLDALISKDYTSEEELTQTLDEINQGRRHITPHLDQLRRNLNRTPDAWWKILTNRELELIPMFGLDMTDGTIAALAQANRATVRVHRQNIMRKLGLHRYADLVTWSLVTGFVTAEQLRDRVSGQAAKLSRTH